MRFRVLGPLRVWNGTRWCAIRADHQRLVLALLLIEAGRAVSTDRLIDEVWGASPPKTARNTIQAYVVRLRRTIDGGFTQNPLATSDHGYELTIGDADLDAGVFQRLGESAERCLAAGDREAAVTQLADALALWGGPAFANVAQTSTVAAETGRLEQARLSALETRLGIELDLGRHAQIVDELAGLVAENPLREQFRVQHMLALHRCGRRAEALQAYREGREILIDELGVEPGRALRELESAILRDDQKLTVLQEPPRPVAGTAGTARAALPTPAQLPNDISAFTGRATELQQLDNLLTGEDVSRRAIVVTLIGPAGVGKTALAVRWAHRAGDRFPDGQLYADLRGYSAEPPLRPIDALARLLPALGVEASRIPAGVDEAAALYRSLVAGKRILVLLDNARHADQVRALLPASPGCCVLVTSREQLGGLVAQDGAFRIPVGVLAPAEARRLLAASLGARRAQAEPAAIGELAELCGRLPLALRIAAAHLATRPGKRIEELAAQLRTGNRLDILEIEGDSQAAVRAAFDLSYAGLPVEDRRLFRLLGLVPGSDVTAPAAADLAGRDVGGTSRGLERLAGSHLLEDRAGERYGLHDLLRLYAAERAAQDDDAATREAARHRLFDHYLRTGDAAAKLLYANKVRLPMPDRLGQQRPVESRFANQASALAWLDAERQNLAAVVRHTARHGPYEIAWLVSDVLRGYFFARRDTVDWPVVSQAALEAAEAHGDPRSQASARLGLGMLHWVRGAYERALEHDAAARSLAHSAGWAAGESSALGCLGNVHRELGRLNQAAECFTEALRIDRRIGWRTGQAAKLGGLGLLSFLLGRLEPAAERLREGIALQRAENDRSGEAVNLVCLAEVLHAQGRFDLAREALDQAYALNRQVGTHGNQTSANLILALLCRDTGELTRAFELATAAVRRARDTGASMHEADGLILLAAVHDDRGQPRAAASAYRQALDVARRIGAGYTEAEALIGLASAQLHDGHLERAGDNALAALGITRRAGYRMLQGQALAVLAEIRQAQHRPGEAARQARAALAIHAETGHAPGAERTRRLLHDVRSRAS